MVLVSDVVRNKAFAVGAVDWVEGLSSLIAEIAADWGIEVGEAYLGGTEAFVARADLSTGEAGGLKLMIPRPGDHAAAWPFDVRSRGSDRAASSNPV